MPIQESSFVRCPVTITSPAPPAGFPLPPSSKCGARCAISNPAPMMDIICPYGHRFIATMADVQIGPRT